MPSRLDHVGVAVHDADAASKFYHETFGFEIVHDEQLEYIGVRLVYLNTGTTMLQLVEPIGPGAVHEHLVEKGEGLHHLCFAVDDISTFLHNHPTEHADVFRGGHDRPACFITSRPNNVLIELIETGPDASPRRESKSWLATN